MISSSARRTTLKAKLMTTDSTISCVQLPHSLSMSLSMHSAIDASYQKSRRRGALTGFSKTSINCKCRAVESSSS